MRLISTSLFLSTLIALAKSAFSPIWYLQTPSDTPKIIDFSTTLQLPDAANPPILANEAVYWPGMLTENGDFVQSIAMMYSKAELHVERQIGCQLKSIDKFCIFGYALADSGKTIVVAENQTGVDQNTDLGISYVWDAGSNDVTQTITQNGSVISTLTTSK
jgi:hypothetical protein